MGYYTDYRLGMWDKDANLIEQSHPKYDEIATAFANLNCDFTTDDFDELTGGMANWKWYNSENDMETLGKQFPDVLFELEGMGEDREDWWVYRVLGNKTQLKRAVITSPDESEPNSFDVPIKE